ASSTGAKSRRALARLSQAYAKLGDTQNATAAFLQLLAGSRDDYALEAALGLDELESRTGAKPNEFDALRRARVYLFNRHGAEAGIHLVDIVDRFPGSLTRPEALYQAGFALYREEKYDDAIKWFERAHSESPQRRKANRVITGWQRRCKRPGATKT